MFGFFKKKSPRTETKKQRQFPLASELDDVSLISFIKRVFADGNVVVASLFLIGLQNFSVYRSVFLNSMKDGQEYPPSMDGMVAFILDAHSEHLSLSMHDEINSRRWFYLYVAALLTIAHLRAKQKSELWNDLADVWVSLMPGARALRSTIDCTSIWKPTEVDFFNEVRTEDDGEKFIETILIPNEIRYHKKLMEWHERDLPQDIRDELARMDKMIRGEG